MWEGDRMKTISGIEFASEHNGTDVFRLIELAYEQGWKDGHSEQLGTNLAEVGTDLIRRQAVLDALNNIEIPRNASWYQYYQHALTAVDKLPSAEPKRIRGKWIYCEDSTADSVDGYRCDQCGLFVPWDYKHKGIDFIQDYNFCPNCGADMREVTT